jgi:steroid delta-isomerase-like uncharacterized protein
MSAAENVTVAKRFWRGLNRRDIETVDRCLAVDFVAYPHYGKVMDRNAYKLTLAAMMQTFPDLHVREEQIVADDDCVAMRLVAVGTDRNGLLGAPASRKRPILRQAYFMDFKAGKIKELRTYSDEATFDR